MSQVLTGILLFITGYVITKFLLGLVPSLKEVSEPLAVVAGALCGLIYAGVVVV